jgi:hypothetical protein
MTAIPFSKRILAGMAGGQNVAFSGLEPFRTELRDKHKVLTTTVEKGSTDFKCQLLFMGIVATLAAALAAWLFISYGDGGFYPAIGLSAVSGCFIVGMVIAYVMTDQIQKKLEKAFAEDADTSPSFNDVLNNVEDSIDNQRKLRNLPRAHKELFFDQVFEEYQKKDVLTQPQKDVLNSLKNDPNLIAILTLKRTRALSSLRLIDLENSNENLIDAIIATVGVPLAIEEVNLLAKLPGDAVERYLQKLPPDEQTAYKNAFLNLCETHPEPYAGFIQHLLHVPTNRKEIQQNEIKAQQNAKHEKAVKERSQKDHNFAWSMIFWLPENTYPELVTALLHIIGIPNPGTNDYNFVLKQHPQALEQAKLQKESQIHEFSAIPPILGAKIDERFAKFAEDPLDLVEQIHNSPLDFRPDVVAYIFSFMYIATKITFLQHLSKSRENGEKIARTEAVIELLLQQVIPIHVKEDYAVVPDNIKSLLAGLGKWPNQAAEYLLCNEAIELDSKLMECFLEGMTHQDLKQFMHYAPGFLDKNENAPQSFRKWLSILKIPDWNKQIMLGAPAVLAKALSCVEDPKILARGEALFKELTPPQQTLYQQTFLEHFLSYYEHQVFEVGVHSEKLQQLFLSQIKILLSTPNLVKNNSKMAKRYFDLLVNVEKVQKLITKVMSTYPQLCVPCIISFHGWKARVPVYRLVGLSPLFKSMFEDIPQFSPYFQIELDADAAKFSKNVAPLFLKDTKFSKVAPTFIQYLVSGKLDPNNDLYELAYLAQHYQIEELTSMTSQKIASEPLHKRSKGLEWGLIDSKFRMNCAVFKEDIAITYEVSKIEIVNSPVFGKHFAWGPMKRKAVVRKVLPMDRLQEINTELAINSWSTLTPEIAIQQCLSLYDEDGVLNFAARKSDLRGLALHNLDMPALAEKLGVPVVSKVLSLPILIKIFLQCAEVSKERPDLSGFSATQLLTLYTLTRFNQATTLQSECLLAIQNKLMLEDLDCLLITAAVHAFTDLFGLSLAFISQNSILKAYTPKCPTPDLKNKIMPILDGGMKCAALKIGLEYKNGSLHLTLPTMNRKIIDEVADLLNELHKLVPISHISATPDDWKLVGSKFCTLKFEKVHLFKSQEPEKK